MGGKKQSQRTKNNARPSSSGRSAELLHSQVRFGEGLTTTSLFSNNAAAKIPALFPSLAGTAIESGVYPEFALCFKKLNKKDPITKTKALQELTELVKNSKVDDVVAVLPTWAHFYKILTIDLDRKVREATQVCHAATVGKAGRRLAPHVRALAPAWLLAQYDDHAPAQAAAAASLATTFPDTKLPEVIAFCREEIMALIMENLLGAADDIINKKVAAEERACAAGRARSAALRALQLAVRRLPRAQAAWLQDKLQPLEDHAPFWKLAAHDDANVRASWYGCVASVAAAVPVARLRARAVAALATSRETSATAARARLAALTQLMAELADWYSLLDKKDGFRKRVLEILESGGYGEARQTASFLVPLLTHLPEDLRTEEFYVAFFDSAFKGLEKKQVMISKSERQHWLSGIIQCILHLSTSEAIDASEAGIRAAVARLADIASLPGTISPSLSQIPLKWLPLNSPKISLLLLHFWHSLTSSLLSRLNSPSIEVIQSQSHLLHTLKTSIVPKKLKSIKFHDEPPSEPIEETTEQIDTKLADNYYRDLNKLVAKICSRYLEIVHNENRSDIISPLFGILSEFNSETIFKSIARDLNSESVYKLYENVVKSWLYEKCMQTSDVVNLVFLMIRHMSDDEQDLVFQSFDNAPDNVIVCCVNNCSRCDVSGAGKWAKGAAVGQALSRAAASGHGATGLALTERKMGVFLISDSAVSGILQTLAQRVRRVWQNREAIEEKGKQTDDEEVEREDTSADHDCITVSQAVTLLAAAGRTEVSGYEELILELLHVALNVPGGSSISVDTWREVVSSIQDGVAARPKNSRNNLMSRIKDILHGHCFSQTELNLNKIEQSTSLCPYLLQCNQGPADEVEIEELTKVMFQSEVIQAASKTEIHALRYDCLTMRLNCMFEDDNDFIKQIIEECDQENVEGISKDCFVADANSLLFRAMYFQSIFLHDDKDEDKSEGNWCDVLLQNKYFLEEFSKVLYDYSVLCSLYESHAFWPHYQLISDTYDRVQCSILGIIFEGTSSETFAAISKHVCDVSAEKGYYWSRALADLNKWKENETILTKLNQDLIENLTGNGYVHNLLWSTLESRGAARLRALYAGALRAAACAHPALAARCYSHAASPNDPHDPDFIIDLYYRHKHIMFYDSDITPATWQQIVALSSILEYLSELVEQRGWSLQSSHWDFITITLTSLAMTSSPTTKCCMLTRSLLRLLARVSAFVDDFRRRAEVEEPSKDIANLIQEWRDVFQGPATNSFMMLLMDLLEKADTLKMSVNTVALISGAIEACRSGAATGLGPPGPRGPASPRGPGADRVPRLWEVSAEILAGENPLPVQFLAYHAMVMTHKALVLYDAEQLSLWSTRAEDDDVTSPNLAISFLRGPLTRTLTSLNDMLEPYPVGVEFCAPRAGSPLQRRAGGAALLLLAAHRLRALQHADLQHHYMQLCREERYGELIVYACCRLMPRGCGAELQAWCRARADPAATDWLAGTALQALYCRVLAAALAGWAVPGARAAPLPARAECWLSAAVSAYIAPDLVRAELQALLDSAPSMEDVQVSIHWSAQEAHVVALVEDRPVALALRYSRRHPLDAPRVLPAAARDPLQAGTHWLTLYLAYQNGSLVTAVQMWCSAIRGRVSRAAQCYICYCRLQPNSGRLPAVPCHQCHNKFHTECLRKWFQSSHKSNCPLCRTNF